MAPSLRLFDGVALPSYGLMLFISFLVGIILFDNRLRRGKVLPKILPFNWAWMATDIFLAVLIGLAGIWAGLFAPEQWYWLKIKAPLFKTLFRIAAVLFAAYMVYGSIAHLGEHRRTRQIESAEFTTYLAMWILFSAIGGARLLYVVLHIPEFQGDWIGVIAFWRGGLNGLIFYGGFVGAMVMGIVFALANRIRLPEMLDAVIPSIVLGEFFTRIGCFLNGCCFGRVCYLPWAVRFPKHSPAGFLDATIHPTQLYSSLAGLILFLIALALERRRLAKGMLFGIILLLYSLFRFGIDFVRYYENAANLWTNQAIAIALSLVAVTIIITARRRDQSAAVPDEPTEPTPKS